MRTVYLGTSAFAAAVLEDLGASRHRPLLVVSRPDSPAGRGRRLTPPPAVQTAAQLGIPVLQPQDVNDPDVIEQIGAVDPEVLIVCAYGALIREPLLSRWPILNLHPSLLPRWRGAAPIERAILAGDSETGVSIIRLTAELDSGPICLQERARIDPDDDYGTLSAKLERLGARLLVEALELAAAGTLDPRFAPQPQDGVTYAEKLTAADRRLDPGQSTAEQVRRVHALSPHIGAYLELDDGSRLGVWDARERGGKLQPLEVQPPGKRRMAFADYERGLRR